MARITSEQVEKIIEAVKKGREAGWKPFRFKLLVTTQDGKPDKACVNGAGLIGLGLEAPFLEAIKNDDSLPDSDGDKLLNSQRGFAQRAAAAICEAVGVDHDETFVEFPAVFDLDYAMAVAYDEREPSSLETLDPNAGDDEAFFAWLRGLVVSGE